MTIAGCAVVVSTVTQAADLQVFPAQVRLDGPEAEVQLVVMSTTATDSSTSGSTESASIEPVYAVADSTIAEVNSTGLIRPLRQGMTSVTITMADQRRSIPVTVEDLSQPFPVSFHNDVIPALTKLGCNSGGCHGKAEGQNGFKLSVFGFDAAADYEAMVKQNRGRRVNRVWPSESLILGKATGRVPHGGGRRTDEQSAPYRTVLRWLAEGAVLDERPVPITHIEAQPSASLLALNGRQQLRVVAHLADGTTRDVTRLSEFQSNADGVATVSGEGLVEAKGQPGEAAILMRFLDQLATMMVTIPRTDTDFNRPAEHNFIDRLVWDKLQRLGIQPSDTASDAEFLRRAFLDTIGTLPTTDEARRFLSDTSPGKRADLIDRLLARDEYSIYQSLKWADLLRLDGNALGPESAIGFHRWLRKQFRDNRPYDEFVQDILTARGSTQSESPAALYLTLNEPKELGSSISQLFLGVRIECAECHHHPFEKWSQEDFYSFAGLFTSVRQKNLPGGAKAIMATAGADLKHPKTSEPVMAKGLGESRAADAELPIDRRQHLAEWITRDSNPYFARTIVNRTWAAYFGRGLVDPVDDLRATNPASNEPLLTALADHLRESDYDLKTLQRTILESHTYQLSSTPTASNAEDEQNFSRVSYRAVPAEVLLDAICQVTGTKEKFNGWPVGARAIEVWDNRMPSYFFRIFGRPTRTTVCACERGDAPSISQALHLMNSPEISDKVAHRHGRARQLADSSLTPDDIIDELYLATLSRFPGEAERELMQEAFSASPDRRSVVEDLMWTLLNTKEFLFNH
ncbi:MAG: DUF1549 and DUF1553 domain-containing protein [Fuerstiella sp.]